MIKKCVTCGKEFETGKHKEKLNCSKECLKIYQEENKESRLEKATQGLMKKYGVDHIAKIPGHAEKMKETKKRRYGDENYTNREKYIETSISKYGVDNPMKLKENQEKAKNTKNERYGDENYNNKEKTKETVLKKYGKEHHLQVKEIMDKQIETNLRLYKSKYNIGTEKAKECLRKENLKNINAEYYFSSDIHLLSMIEKKKDKIKEMMESQGFDFDIDKYKKLRNKEDGRRFYINYEVKCKKCGNIFETFLKNKPIICRVCYPIKGSSSIMQRELADFLKSININFTENNRKIIKPLELDFYFQEHNLAIELNGNYWHSELNGEKDKKYHLNKTIQCFEKGIHLIHVFEDEWLLNKEIVKSRIVNLLKKTENKIYARKCEVIEISNFEKSLFLEQNHLQGDSVDKIRVALKYNGEIVSVMTFSKNRVALGGKNEDGTYELTRFCSKLNYNVIGAFNKLLSFFEKKYIPKKINTYADCRWSGVDPEETIYNKLGFSFAGKTPPSYFYILKKDYINRMHRFSFAKHILLKKFGGDPLKTEWELAQENNYDRIWDCGTLKFSKSF